MRDGLAGTARGRAIIAVIALYGLCLQAFLGALAPPPPTSPESAICAHDTSGQPSDPAPACRHACCTLAHAGQVLPAQAMAFETVAWPASAPPSLEPDRTTTWARAPPDRSIGPRGPPVA